MSMRELIEPTSDDKRYARPASALFAPFSALSWQRDRRATLSSRVRHLLLVALLLAPAASFADGPVPPCGDSAKPGYPAVGVAPEARFLRLDGGDAVWTPPDCAGWTVAAPALVLGLAGRFSFAGGVDEMLVRIGAVSSLRGIQYWSVTDQAWREFITDAAALSEPDARRRRPDFTVAELRRGEDLHFFQIDSRSSEPVVYRARLREIGSIRIVVEFENVSTVHALRLFPIYGPGDVRMTIFLDRVSDGVWGYYALSAIRETPTVAGEMSFAARAAAFYRHIAGIATTTATPPLMASEGAPPAAPPSAQPPN